MSHDEPPFTDTPLPADLAARIAELPTELPPATDLWPAIHAAIAPVPRRAPPARWAWGAASLAAAAAIAVTSAWLTARTLRPTAPPPEPPVAVLQWEREIRQTTDELLGVLADRREDLDPDAIATIERALSEIDAAILDIRQALQRDPASESLRDALATAYQHKVQVLRAVPELP